MKKFLINAISVDGENLEFSTFASCEKSAEANLVSFLYEKGWESYHYKVIFIEEILETDLKERVG